MRTMRIVACILMAVSSVRARNWVDVIDTTIYASALVDDHKTSMQVWGAVDSYLDASPPLADEGTATSVPVANIVEVPTPTIEPTQSPTDLPTATPSAVPSEALITCDDEFSYPYVIRMHDTWGDGWNGAKLKISTMAASVYSEFPGHSSVFEGTLKDGFDSHSYVCLSTQVCYDVSVEGEGKWLEEVKWDIRDMEEADDDTDYETRTVAKGDAPSNCKFSVPSREAGHFACPFQCVAKSSAPTQSPTLAPTKVLPTPAPTFLVPTEAPSKSDQGESEPVNFRNSTASDNTITPGGVDASNVGLPPRDAEIISKIPYIPPDTPSSGPTASVDPLKTGSLDAVSYLPSDLPSMAPSVLQPTLVPTDGHIKLGDISSLLASSSASPTADSIATEEIELAGGSPRDIITTSPPANSPTIAPTPSPEESPSPRPTVNHNSYHSFFFKFQQLSEQANEEQLPSDYPSLSPTDARFV